MDFGLVVMWLGFILASYSVVGNDVIQTLGTFLTSNEKSMPWYVLWGFAATILSAALIYGYVQGDLSYGRLDKYSESLSTLQYSWYYLLPPVVLLGVTRIGIPVSTTFMILTLFSLSDIPAELGPMVSSLFDSSSKLGGMIQKSLMGYIVAFSAAIITYGAALRYFERRVAKKPKLQEASLNWIIAQWFSTGFLWYQWLTQDLANIYVYHRGGNDLGGFEFALTLIILCGLLAYIFYRKGGAVQEVVRVKTNTAYVRSATIIDFIYALVLYVFKYDNFMGMEYEFPWTGNLPMSTTWVFIGLLAGRELPIRWHIDGKLSSQTWKTVGSDLGKVFLGLLISVVLVFAIKLLAG
jgi:hypothetical protein